MATTTIIDNNNFHFNCRTGSRQQKAAQSAKGRRISSFPERLVDQTQPDSTILRVLQCSDLHCVVRQEEVLKDLDLLKTTSAAPLVLLEKAEGEDVTVVQQSQSLTLNGPKLLELVVRRIIIINIIKTTRLWN